MISVLLKSIFSIFLKSLKSSSAAHNDYSVLNESASLVAVGEEETEEKDITTVKPVYKFSKRSLNNLKTAHPDLQRLAHAILEEMDITVICGYRGMAEQEKAFKEGRSKLRYPISKHNKVPARAIDIVPVPLDWNNIESFEKMCLVAEDKARELGIKIRLGRDFSFKDYPHIELNY